MIWQAMCGNGQGAGIKRMETNGFGAAARGTTVESVAAVRIEAREKLISDT